MGRCPNEIDPVQEIVATTPVLDTDLAIRLSTDCLNMPIHIAIWTGQEVTNFVTCLVLTYPPPAANNVVWLAN